MSCSRIIAFCLAISCLGSVRADDFFDRLEQTLRFTANNDQLRARLSGTVDLEGYYFSDPAPGLIDTTSHALFSPRLTLFLDAQIGSQVYLFAQSRVDRHFDPSDHGAQIRLDEYAVRVTPFERGQLNLQAGKFPTVVGNWIGRHLSWDNPFINAPLPYENVTAITDLEVPFSPRNFLHPNLTEKYEHNPILWGPDYATGFSVAGRLGQFDYAAELKNSTPSSRPESWDATRIGFDHPTISGRLGFRPNEMWTFGISGSDGAYLRPEAGPALPRGRGIGDFRELLVGQDVSFAWHHFQLWAEFYEARFEVPRVGDADTFAYFIEAKYKFAPQFFGAVRWNQQLFGWVADENGNSAQWGRDIWRIETAVAYRFTPHTQLKLQYNLQRESSRLHAFGHTLAAQVTVRF